MTHDFDPNCRHCSNKLVEVYFKWIAEKRPDVADQIAAILWPDKATPDNHVLTERGIWKDEQGWMWLCSCGLDPRQTRCHYPNKDVARYGFESHRRMQAAKRAAIETGTRALDIALSLTENDPETQPAREGAP